MEELSFLPDVGKPTQSTSSSRWDATVRDFPREATATVTMRENPTLIYRLKTSLPPIVCQWRRVLDVYVRPCLSDDRS